MGPQIVIEKLETEDSQKRIPLPNKRKLDDSGIDNDISKKKIKLECQFSNLPDLAVIKIFSYLGYVDLSRAALVCTDWKKLSMAQELWRRIDFHDRSDVNATTVKKLLKRSKGIKYIDLSKCRFINNSVISEIAKQKRLQTLNLNRCTQLSPQVFRSVATCRTVTSLNLRALPLTDDALAMISKSCTRLIDLDISNCDITTKGLVAVLQNCTQMKKLTLDACRKVDDEFLIALSSNSYPLERLLIVACNFTARGLKSLRKMSKLKKLDASQVQCMCDDVVSVLSNLEFLALEHLEDITDEGVTAIVRNNPNLELFSVAQCRSITDNSLELISKSPCRSTLKWLFINDCLVSEIGISRILQNCTKLDLFSFSNIETETVTKWRSEYPHIKFNFNEIPLN